MIVIITVLFGMFCAAMEALITATIFPTVIAQLGGMELYPWIINAFLLSFIIVTPIFGKLSDTIGYKKVYLTAVAIFCVSSMLCGAAQTMPQLIVFRGLQGIGTGGLITMSIIFFGEIFPLEKRPRMQALLSSMWAIASLLGPAIGAFFVRTLSWRWAFYINIPAGLVIFTLIALFADSKRTEEHHKPLDKKGLGLFIFCSFTFVYSLIELSQLRFTAIAFSSLGASLLTGGFFIRHLFSVPAPFIPRSLFRIREVVLSVSLGFLAGFFLFCTANFLPMYVQGVLGLSAAFAGRVVTSMALGSFSGAILCGVFLNRKGFRLLTTTGALFIILGYAFLALHEGEAGLWKLMLCNYCIGVGISSIANACIIAAQASSPQFMLGSATSMFHFFRSFGGVIGIAAMGGLQLGIFRRSLKGLIDNSPASRSHFQEFLEHPQQIFNLGTREMWSEEQARVLENVLAGSIQAVFLTCFVLGFAALLLCLRMPATKPREYSIAEDPIPLEE